MNLRKLVFAVFLIILGTIIAAISLYQSSMVGVFAKMGIADKDYSNYVNYDNYNELQDWVGEYVNCDDQKILVEYWNYYVRGRKGYGANYKMGERRMACGIEDIGQGRVKKGLLSITKSEQYLSLAVREVNEVCVKGEEPCVEYLEKSERVLSWYGILSEHALGSVREVVHGKYDNFRQNVDLLR